MKKILIISIIIFSCSEKQNTKIEKTHERFKRTLVRKKDMSNPNNKLTGKIETLELQYIVWGCACANWVEIDKYEKFQKKGILGEKTIFIEPADKKLELPENFDAFKQKIIVKGQFYINPDYPKGTPETEEDLKKAPVFRYTELKIKKL